MSTIKKLKNRIWRATSPDCMSGDIDEYDEGGFVTAEYAVGILAAVAFAGVLLAVVKSGAIKSLLSAIISSALSV